ncbi:MAG: DNA polymerase III subunit alpha [Sulfobacillus acidophilus]|uniref:DNA-directed DNA polymerase n=1 Tax=Sulfobacillus acidophilus TaxID=53633 RepID=A0A2T2WDF2_9FIRM|nr:MAG: DNA polymerase III subunit alpha [Sulfobacillus acidophilus]
MIAPLTDVWSGYSLLRSVWKVPDLVGELERRGFETAVLADWMTLAGTEEFDRRMRQAGLFPLVGVTRLWQAGGGLREVRLVACLPEAWPTLVRFNQWGGRPQPGLTVILGASAEMWWTGAISDLPTNGVVVELAADQREYLNHLPRDWRWVPARRVRCSVAQDREALALLAQIGGFAMDPEAVHLPTDPTTWLEPYASWPREQMWQPKDEGSVFARHVFKMPRLPGVPDEDAVLRAQAQAGLADRYGKNPSDRARERLQAELQVITALGFSGYFLMVADVVGWAQGMGIRVGPGRGSAAGSLVSYALHITDVDPLRYGLVFERFLNPARHTLPDIDLDFEDTRRGEVIEYLRRRHGRDCVAQIGTYGTFGARAALRDVARAQGLPSDQVSAVLKSCEWALGDMLADHVEGLKAACQRVQLNSDWIDLAVRLEGLPRHRSTHAAGVIIAPGPLTEWLYCQGDAESGWISDFEMGSIEQLGFVKLDVLGLRTLTTVARIEDSLAISPTSMDEVDERDEKTLKLLGRGDTDGVFQLDGRGVKSLLRQMRPTSREEVMLVVALYRPGPMDAIGELLNRRAAQYHPSADDPLASLLRDTYGVMVYQEQLMAAVQQIAGFSMAKADLIRRAISKKDHAMLNQEEERLIANMIERGYSKAQAQAFWNRIQAFGDYGFNKSHACSYGVLSYYLAYLKAHYPLHFWAAELSGHESDKLKDLMTQVVSQGIFIAMPHVNRSAVDFSVQGDKIVAGLGMIRGLGLDRARRIVAARQEQGPFQDVDDLVRRGGFGRDLKFLEALAKAGALSGLGAIASAIPTQMQLFEGPPTQQDPKPVFQEAFGFGWPHAEGPIYVRLAHPEVMDRVRTEIQGIAAKMPGEVTVALISEHGRAVVIPGIRMGEDHQTIEMVKEIDGVQAAGRRVTLIDE